MTSTSEKAVAAGVSRMRALRSRVRASRGGALAWRVSVAIVGVAVIAGGIVLLPLPGPGWLIIFAGLGILASEFEWASRLLRRARELVGGWTRWITQQPWWVRALVGLAGLLLVAGLVAAAVWWYLLR